MKKILIVNLRRLGDVYSTGHLINSLSQTANSEISILCYKESVKAARNLANVKNIYVIDRQELITITTNKLFTDSLALDQLFKSLEPIKNEQWDTIVNFSNDSIAANLCSYLSKSTNKTVGVHFNDSRNIETNGPWEIVFNDVLPTMKNSPMHFTDCYHRMMQIPPARTGERLKLNSEHNQTALKNISELRGSVSGEHKSNKVIAIQALSANASKNIPEDTLVKYIKLTLDAGVFVPLLLIAPTNEERDFANRVNAQLNDSLVVVESDLNAVASVVGNIDLLVTVDTVIKHIADLCETPVLEISLGNSPFLKQGTYNIGSLVLTDNIKTRKFSSEDQTSITADDLFASTIYYFSNSKSLKPNLSENVTLYRTTDDEIGINYVPVSGSIDHESEIQRLMSRQFLSLMLDNSESEEIYQSISTFKGSAASNWCNQEKALITDVMKDLLGTLRSLLQSLETKRSSRDFIINLGKLMSHCETESVTQVATIMFKAKLEGINAKTFEENAREVETLLYELKSNLQKNLSCIKSLEEKLATTRKDEFINKGTLSEA